MNIRKRQCKTNLGTTSDPHLIAPPLEADPVLLPPPATNNPATKQIILNKALPNNLVHFTSIKQSTRPKLILTERKVERSHLILHEVKEPIEQAPPQPPDNKPEEFILFDEPIDSEKYPETVGKLWLPIESLKREKQYNESYKSLVDGLRTEHHYVGWKRVRGDGNCYYRAVMYSYLEYLVHPHTEYTLSHFISILNNETAVSENDPVLMQQKQHALKCLSALGLLCIEQPVEGFKRFHSWMQDYEMDRALIFCLRILAADYIIRHQESDDIFPYIIDGIRPVVTEILKEKEEAEGITLLIVPKVLQIQVIQHMLFERLIIEKFPNESESRIAIPIIIKVRGHYDVLYSRDHLNRDQYDIETRTYYLK